ncbi:small integral membrane protein 26 [Ornithorhynchus anatinus]|uniref:Small integral membrane protein 26 n=1 Tax=Ornithorhynchus anatinus TaxID=9258 RepID=A0A6I8N7Q0_ORNAN|nr:small integral membrane protein 26 [Ornithorhynchus anatinus]
MEAATAVRWYKRMSLLYALGAWTTLASALVYHWMRPPPPPQPQGDGPDDREEQREEHPAEMPSPRKGFHVETTFTYRENFVPYTTRIFNLLKSWTGGPGPAE